MTYKEFTIEIAPMVLELQNECKEMTEGEFEDFQQKCMSEIKDELSKKFIALTLDMIRKNIFEAAAGEKITSAIDEQEE